MRSLHLLPLLAPVVALTTPPAAAQVAPGELLMSTFTAAGGFAHHASDGGEVAAYDPWSSGLYTGAAILPDGTWAACRRAPAPGLVVYDPASGGEVLNVDVPGLTSDTGDVALRSDGSLVLADWGADVLRRVDPATGILLDVYPVPADGGFGLWIDEADEMWVTDFKGHQVLHLAADGTFIGTFSAVEPYDVVKAPDGTLWVHGGGFIQHFEQDGTSLGFFDSGIQLGYGLALMEDGTLWASGWGTPELRHFDATGALLHSEPTGSFNGQLATPRASEIGTEFCAAEPNSTGAVGRLSAYGSLQAARNDVRLVARDLPTAEFGYFLNSDATGFHAFPGGSAGILCLGGAPGRHAASPRFTGVAGSAQLQLDLAALPRPGGPITVQPGDTWNFQFWHRDGGTSNFTTAVGLEFE